MQLSEQRKAQDDEVSQKIQQVEQYLPWQERKLLEELQQISSSNLMSIHESDPVEAQRLFIRQNEIKSELDQIKAAKQEIEIYRLNQRTSQIEAEREPAYQILRERIPVLMSGSSGGSNGNSTLS